MGSSGYACKNTWPVISLAALLLACVALPVQSSDPDPLQDFCVGLLDQDTTVNGFLCKDPKQVTADDFKSTLFRQAGNTSNKLGSAVTPASVRTFPGLNTLGISINRVDLAPNGVNPPHVHPRATELIFLVQGTLYVGFIDTNNTLWATTIYAGDLFVVPRGLVHFQLNVGKDPSVTIAAFNSQNPGASRVAPALFAASPPIQDQVLETAFGIDKQELDLLIKSVSTTL